jgi:hypothetical protein
MNSLSFTNLGPSNFGEAWELTNNRGEGMHGPPKSNTRADIPFESAGVGAAGQDDS